jgi:hypothetical protein
LADNRVCYNKVTELPRRSGVDSKN